MDANDLYWLFSTIAQTLAAIVALVGMVCVYRFQGIHTSKWNILQNSMEVRWSYFTEDSYTQNAEKFLEALSKKKGIGDQRDLAKLNAVKCGLVELLESQAEIRLKFIIFLLFNLTVILLCISALPFCKDLVSWGIPTVILTVTTLAESFVLTGDLCISLIPRRRIIKD